MLLQQIVKSDSVQKFFHIFSGHLSFSQSPYFQQCSDIQSTCWFTEDGRNTEVPPINLIPLSYLDTHTASLALQVHRKIREDSDMAQDSLQCLAQLASMHGPIFPDESAQVSYLAHLVEGLLSMINGSVCRCAGKFICGLQLI